MVFVKKFSEFASADLTDSANKIAGISGSSVNIIGSKIIIWTTATRPAPPTNALLGFNTTTNFYEYYDSSTAAWQSISIVGGSVTLVNTGTGLNGGPITTTGTIALDVPVLVSSGGTGGVSFTAYSLICGGITATSAFQSVVSVGLSGEVLTSNGPGALPSFSAVAGTGTINSGNAGELAYYQASGIVLSGLTSANSAMLVTNSTGIPAWTASLTNGKLLIGSNGATPVVASLSPGTNITIAEGAGSITINATGIPTTIPVPLAEGGTNAVLVADVGAIPYSTASAMAFLAATTTASQVMLSGSNAAPTWSTATYPATTTINQLLYSSAANTIAGITAANSAMLVSSSAGVPSWTASLTDGQILIGNSGSAPTVATLSPGTGINIVGGSGSITISAIGSSGFAWNEVTGTSDNIAVGNAYITNNAGLVTMTLPATAAVGDTFAIVGKGAGGWKIAQNASQIIQVGSVPTIAGTGGSVASINQYDSITLVCVTANTLFVTQGGPQGSLTVVGITYTIATGGAITIDGDYKIHSFTSNGTFEVTTVGDNNEVEYLVIGGGGGGGSVAVAGGGGAGGLYTSDDDGNKIVTATTYTVVVGAGGAKSTNGGDSSFHGVTAPGGGGGGDYGNPNATDGNAGGSGGGGGTAESGTAGVGGAGTAGHGYNGGNGGTRSGLYPGGGGGGGAGGVGANQTSIVGGAGGVGRSISITGTAVFYAGGGGGGGIVTSGGSGGVGGNGGGGHGQEPGANGTANTGGGGGGSGSINNGNTGGSGIVIIRYLYK
jgi:hypothetical protein